MTTYGLTPDGFVPKTTADVIAELEADERAAYGQSIDVGVSGRSVFDQFNGIIGGQMGELWDLAQAVYSAGDPDASTFTGLDAVCSITGTIRDDARATTCTVTLCGVPATVVLAANNVSVLSTKTKFATATNATIAALPAWASGTYATGARVTVGGQCYVVTVPGVSTIAPAGTVLYATETVTGVEWRNIGAGSGAVDVLAVALVEGPLVSLAGTLAVIETPVTGWSTVINLVDAEVGADVEEDPGLRVRREDEIVSDANATAEAIREKVLRVGDGTNDPVTSVRVFQNFGMVTDAGGRPPKSVECLVVGGDDQAIAEAIFAAIAGGIESTGNVSKTVIDPLGVPWTIKFSRATALPIYIILNVEKDPTVFPFTGAADIISAVVKFGLTYRIGRDVVSSAVASPVWVVPGVLDVHLPLIGTAPTPTLTTTIVCGDHQLADFDSSRIIVNLTDGTP